MRSDKLVKSVFLIHSRPVKGSLTLKARKLTGALARLAGRQYRTLPLEQRTQIEDAVRAHVSALRAGTVSEVPPILFQPRFTAKLRDLADLVGHDPSDSRHLMQDLQLLLTTRLELNLLGHGAAKAEQATFPHDLKVFATLVSSLAKAGRGLLSWGYDPLVLLIMVDPRTYTDLSLELNRNARTYTALALYENVRRFLGTHCAGPYPVRRWQELLSETGEVRSWETFSEFRRKIRRAIKELEVTEGCDVDINYDEVMREGEKWVQFLVDLRPQAQLLFGEPVPEDRELAGKLKLLGFPEGECRTMVDTYGAEYLYAKLELLRRSQERQQIRDGRAWLISALKDDWKDQELEAEHAHKKREQRDQQRQEVDKLRRAFDALRAKTVAETLARQTPEEQDALRRRYIESAAGQRVAAQFGESSKPFQAAWGHWLLEEMGWLAEDHLTDFAVFVLWTTKSAATIEKPSRSKRDEKAVPTEA